MISILRRSLLACTACFAIAISAHSAIAAEIVVEHSKGTTTLPGTPEKVFVFPAAALDTLDAIGVEVAGVTKGSKPDYLSKYTDDKYLKIGSLFEPDYEAIAAAAPDLIITGTRSSRKYEELSKIAPTIDLTPGREDFIGDAERNAMILGRIFGKESEVADRIKTLDASMEELRGLASKAGTALAIIATGGKMSAHGKGSRFTVLYDDYGFTPAAEGLDTGLHGAPISFEFLLETDPDWLFVVDRDAAIGRQGTSARELLDNEIVHKTKVWKQGHIVYVNPANWYVVGAGIQALQQNVDEVLAALKAN